MSEFRGEPSKWLLNNSKGYPDFLFTLLVYSFLLFTIICFVWVGLIMIVAVNPSSTDFSSLKEILKDIRIGLVAIAGLVFGLAGNYTVRRFKKDEQHLQSMTLCKENVVASQPENDSGVSSDNTTMEEEDI